MRNGSGSVISSNAHRPNSLPPCDRPVDLRLYFERHGAQADREVFKQCAFNRVDCQLGDQFAVLSFNGQHLRPITGWAGEPDKESPLF